MNTNELTALHTETITAAKTARTLANISRRAATLFADGYKVRGYEGTGFYEVTSPAGDRYKVWHGVKVGYDCTCPAFTEYGTCKHLEAVDLMKQEAAQEAAYDALAGAEASTGCDAYARF